MHLRPRPPSLRNLVFSHSLDLCCFARIFLKNGNATQAYLGEPWQEENFVLSGHTPSCPIEKISETSCLIKMFIMHIYFYIFFSSFHNLLTNATQHFLPQAYSEDGETISHFTLSKNCAK